VHVLAQLPRLREDALCAIDDPFARRRDEHVRGIDSLAVLRQNLAIARGFTPMSP